VPRTNARHPAAGGGSASANSSRSASSLACAHTRGEPFARACTVTPSAIANGSANPWL
jgi:hypothetical protein